jgi:hypothetical protein
MTSGEIRTEVRIHELGRAIEDRFWTRLMGGIALYYMVTSPIFCIGLAALFFDWRFIIGLVLLGLLPFPVIIYLIKVRERSSKRQFVMYVDSDDVYFKSPSQPPAS